MQDLIPFFTSLELQRAILDNVGHAVISTTPDGTITTFNPAAEKMLGYTAAEVVGLRIPTIIHDPDEVAARAKEISDELGTAIAPGFEVFGAKASRNLPNESEWTCIRKDGTRFPALLSVTALRDAAGAITGFLSMAIDLRERKLQQDWFRLVVEASPSGLVMVNEAGVIALVNAQTEKLFGYAREELIGQPVEMLIPQQFRAAHTGLRRGFLADPKVRTMGAGRDLFGLRKDGSEFPLEVGLSPLVTLEGVSVLAAMVDITVRKQAEKALQSLQRYHERILSSVGEGLHGIDREGKITFENPAAAAMLGWDVRDLIGRPAHLTIHHTKADNSPYLQSECPIYATMHDGVTRRVEDEVFWRQDGASFPVSYVSTPLTNDAGEIEGVIVAFRDISVRKRAERLILEKNEELKRFTYTVSHDLKAPLRGIAGYAQELERRHKEGLSERAQFCITQIVSATKNLDNLIEDLLKYSRLDTEALTLTEVNLSSLVQSILSDRSLEITEREIKVNVNVPPVTLRSWERGLHQVLSNLIDNAIKYSRQSKPPRLTINAEATGGVCGITVTDNGVGFDMKYHDRVFGLFNRLVRADEFEGTGVGLAIVKKLVEKLDGSIRAESAPGQGAVFFVELPISSSGGSAP